MNSCFILAIYDKNNNIYYLSYNHQGTLKAITNQMGQILKELEYDSFGNIINETYFDTNGNTITSNPNLDIPFTFAGGLYDKDTKLIKFGYRDYDSSIGRWITKDPIDFEGGDSNLYGYVLGDPVNYVDPWGLADINLFNKNEYLIYHAAYYTGIFSNNFIVSGHGEPGLIASPDNEDINADNLANIIKRHSKYKDGQPVEILSCYSGSDVNEKEDSSLAQQVANRLGVPVVGVRGGEYLYNVLPIFNRPALGATIQTFYPK
jgi:RHS repeat-associated protein